MYSLKTVRIFLTLLLFLVNINLYAQNLYQVTTDVKLRSGPGVKYKSLGIIKNGEKINPIYFFFNDLNAEQYDRLLKIAATGSAKSFD